jgi:hypothetical protein
VEGAVSWVSREDANRHEDQTNLHWCEILSSRLRSWAVRAFFEDEVSAALACSKSKLPEESLGIASAVIVNDFGVQ